MTLSFQREPSILARDKRDYDPTASHALVYFFLAMPITWIANGDHILDAYRGVSILWMGYILERSLARSVGEEIELDLVGGIGQIRIGPVIDDRIRIQNLETGVNVAVPLSEYSVAVFTFAEEVRNYLNAEAPEFTNDKKWGWWLRGEERPW
jgi:hypothetical protein